jgi:D-alanyl-D-alanine carboxypeptidase/D-alanyl-D-alanine-endopeptidase (penicillin-binding protein 4)
MTSARRPLILFIFLSIAVISSACDRTGGAPEVSSPAVSSSEPAPPSIDLAKPLVLSTRPEDQALALKLDKLIEDSEFSSARWGVFAASLKDGRVIAARDAQKLFNPASVQKIVTSVVALDKLGADFKWETRVFATNAPRDGVIDGGLVLYGGGAPDLDAAAIDSLAAKIRAQGIRKITGQIVGDESFFTGDSVGNGWAWNELQWYYGAQASALSVNGNLVNLTLENGEPKIKPATDMVETSGRVVPAAAGMAESVGVKRGLGDNRVHVWGEGKNLDVRVAVDNPPLWAARIFRAALIKQGIEVVGNAVAVDWKSPDKFVPGNSAPLAEIKSAPLGEIVRKMNKDSVNLLAELILRTLGRRFGDWAPDLNPKARNTRGDDAAGADVIRKWLIEKGVGLRETETVADGSGLSRLNFLSPETVGRALIAGAQITDATIFRESLPVSGTDGTLRGRLAGASGKILGKTGSIAYVNTLAGYARRADETLVFVILCNNETRRADSSPLIDSLALELLK